MIYITFKDGLTSNLTKTMRLSKETYDERMLNIISASLRFVRSGNPVNRLPVRLFVKQYGFTHNFSKTEELSKALKDMIKWVDRERSIHGSPSPERMLNFIKVRL